MKRMLFYTYWNFDDAETSGICKKILSQRKVFEEHGYQVDFTFLSHQDFYIETEGKIRLLQKRSKVWTKPIGEKQLGKLARERQYDFVYMRYNCAEWGFIHLLGALKSMGSKIVLEIPTYPYDGTYDKKNVRDQIYLSIDKWYRRRLHSYIDRIVTYGDWEKIFHIPTIKTINGIEVNQVTVKSSFSDSGDIHLICVAMYAKWHGLERILKGLCNYYHDDNEGKRKVFLHVVGDGPAIADYKEIIQKENIGSYVLFHGLQTGEALDKIYKQCDIGVEVLGGHRAGLNHSSSMKSREYLTRGLPFLSELPVDIIPKDWKYLLHIPYDESDIDIWQIVEFYEKYMDTAEKKKRVAEEIRDFAIDKVDMRVTLKEIMEFYDTASGEIDGNCRKEYDKN